MAAPKMRRVTSAQPAVRAIEPEFLCPFSGRPLEFRVCGPDKMVMVISPHGWSSKLFQTMDQAKEWASFSNGDQKFFRSRVEVRHVEAPEPNPLAELVTPPEEVEDLPLSLR